MAEDALSTGICMVVEGSAIAEPLRLGGCVADIMCELTTVGGGDGLADVVAEEIEL